MSAKLIQLLATIISDEEMRKKAGIAVLSIAFGFIYLLCLPVIVMSNLGDLTFDTADIDMSQFTEEAIIAGLDSETQEQIANLQAVGEDIEREMANLGIADQTIKAQLIYMSFFEDVEGFDANEYVGLFADAPDDAVLIDSINQEYDLSIDYDEFMHTYVWVMNSTMNQYMFIDTSTKNAADLSAWANNAYVSGWGYKSGAVGDRDPEDRLRYADNAGLMIGYLNYDPGSKSFGAAYDVLTYTEQGDLTTMPDVAGIGLYDGGKHGVYIGDDKVVYSADDPGYVTKEYVSDGEWTSWCTYEGIEYPQEVQDAIDEINADDDSSEDNDESEE